MTRVGVIGDVWEDSFAFNVIEGLHALGVEAVALGATSTYAAGHPWRNEAIKIVRRLPKVAPLLQNRFVDSVQEHGPLDLIITTDSALLPTTVSQLTVNGPPVVLWFPDHIGQLASHMMLACPYATVYFKDPELVDRIRGLVEYPRVEYLPEACNPRLHRPMGEYGTDRGLVSPGNMYPIRARLIDRLATDDVPVRMYGDGLPSWLPISPAMSEGHQGRSIWGLEKSQIMRAATGVLNNLHIGEAGSVNCRLFDAAGAGAAVLCEYRSALDDLFEVGSEVLAFRTYDDLFKGWRWLTEHPDEAAAMTLRASARAHAEHTHALRLRGVLERHVG